MVSPAQTTRNLGVTLYGQQSFTANITVTTLSCRFSTTLRGYICSLCKRWFWSRLLSLTPRLLQLTLGWFACMYQSTSAANPECSYPAGLQPTQVLPCYTALPHPALATGCWSNTIQDTGTCLLCCRRLRLILPSGHGQAIHLNPSATLCCQSACYSLHKIIPACCPGRWNELPIDTRRAETLHICSSLKTLKRKTLSLHV